MAAVGELRPVPGFPTPARARDRAVISLDGSELVVTDDRGRTTRHPLGSGPDAPAALGVWRQNTGRGTATYLLVLDGRQRRLVEAPAECFAAAAARRFAESAGLEWFDHASNAALPPKAPGRVRLIRSGSPALLVAIVAGVLAVFVGAALVSPWLLLLLAVVPIVAVLAVVARRRAAWGPRGS